MHIRQATVPLLVALVLVSRCCASAAGLTTVDLHANKLALLADGKSITTITAQVRDSSGAPTRGSVSVQFQTTSGSLSAQSVTVYGGMATVRLTSATVEGVARVTAFVSGGSSNSLDIVFTNDPEATFEGNMYIQVLGSTYLAYSATDKVIEAQGSNQGARLTYRNISISADRLQLTCEGNIVRAHDNVVLKRGGATLRATRLYYSLLSGQGLANIEDSSGKLRPMQISGEKLHTANSPTPMPRSYVNFPQLQVKLVIVARSVTYFPNDRLQFRRPKFFQDQTQIMSLPYYELPLNSQELFSDHFVSVGTQGLGLQVPIYYNLSPRSTGIFYIRHMQQIGASSFATEPGWSFDLVQGYSSQGDNHYEGAAGFTGLTRSDWGFRWVHNQQFSAGTQSSFYLDFPQHDGVVSTASLNQQFKRFRWGADLTAGHTWAGTIASDLEGDTFVETQAHRLASIKGLLYTLGTNMTSTVTRRNDIANGNLAETDEGVTFRAFTNPVNLDQRTRLIDSVSFGNVWSTTAGKSGLASLASLALDHTFKGGAGLALNYDFVLNPGGLDPGSGRHRLSALYNFSGKQRLRVSVTASTYLDATDATLLTDLTYRLNRNWRVLGDITLQRYGSESYDDIELTLGRKIGAREVQLTYSTYLSRISFDLTATSF